MNKLITAAIGSVLISLLTDPAQAGSAIWGLNPGPPLLRLGLLVPLATGGHPHTISVTRGSGFLVGIGNLSRGRFV